MDDRIEAFLRDVRDLEGATQAEVREGVRVHFARYEGMFRDAESDAHKKNEAAQRWLNLCRQRLVEEIEQNKGTPTADHLAIALAVIDSPARFPLKDN